MSYTFQYRKGYYIHVIRRPDGFEDIKWQEPDYTVHFAKRVHAAKLAITRHAKRNG